MRTDENVYESIITSISEFLLAICFVNYLFSDVFTRLFIGFSK